MTQRKFKHKETGWIAEEIGTDYHLFKLYNPIDSNKGDIHRMMVENSNDWQEITPELVEGRWYKRNNLAGRWDGNKISRNAVNDCAELNDTANISSGKKWSFDPFYPRVCELEECTPSEIHKALDAIRIEKGLVEGVKVKFKKENAPAIIKRETIYHPEMDDLRVNSKIGAFSNAWTTIYREGQWATKVSEPILVTEDGYGLHEGDKVYKVFKDYNIAGLLVKNHDPQFNEVLAYFHDEENAQSYIENHKPRFSRADLEYIEAGIERNMRASWTKKELCTFIQNQIQNLKQSK